MAGKIWIGTSGWNYQSWIGRFYPKHTKAEDELSYYAKNFQTTELNNSFYQLPTSSHIQAWCKATPDNFIFSCKASRYITHMKKLASPQENINKFLSSIEPFGNKLGPILFQLPPHWHLNFERLKQFVEQLPKPHRYSFEFREPSWLCQSVYDLLAEHNIALCFYDYQGFQSPEEKTSDFIYIRLHGPGKKAYEGSYDTKTLAKYAEKIKRWQKEGKSIYCYFDNDDKSHAPYNAKQLMAYLEKQP